MKIGQSVQYVNSGSVLAGIVTGICPAVKAQPEIKADPKAKPPMLARKAVEGSPETVTLTVFTDNGSRERVPGVLTDADAEEGKPYCREIA